MDSSANDLEFAVPIDRPRLIGEMPICENDVRAVLTALSRIYDPPIQTFSLICMATACGVCLYNIVDGYASFGDRRITLIVCSFLLGTLGNSVVKSVRRRLGQPSAIRHAWMRYQAVPSPLKVYEVVGGLRFQNGTYDWPIRWSDVSNIFTLSKPQLWVAISAGQVPVWIGRCAFESDAAFKDFIDRSQVAWQGSRDKTFAFEVVSNVGSE